MRKIEDIETVAQILGEGGPFRADKEYINIEEVVDDLISLGNTDKVFANHDDHLGLKSELSNSFLQAPLEDAEKSEFQDELESVLDQADIIIPLSQKELSEDDIDEIREDKMSRGEDPNDLDI